MGLMRLSDQEVETLSNEPEIAMGLQIVRLGDKFESLAYVIGGYLVMTVDGALSEALSDMLREPWLQQSEWSDDPQAGEGKFPAFDDWLARLPSTPPVVQMLSRTDLLAMGLIIPPTLPTPPARPKVVYGHLPFKWHCGPDEVFYRWEPFPRSRRLNRSAGTIKADTFAAPASELPLVPSGFAAVARYALPNLLPACFRYELQPRPGTMLDCGASVPLYGQSGGGVEVRFASPSKNRGVIASPIRLSPL